MKLCYSCMQQIEDDQTEFCPLCGQRLDFSNEQKYLQPGTILQGKFIIGKVIGAGGFGNTYIAWNRLLLCKVAIKEFYPSQYVERQDDGVMVRITDPRMEVRFQNGLHQFLAEAKSVASLQDIKGVVSIYNFFEANGTGYFVMEYLEGRDVKNILNYSNNVQTYDWSRRVVLTVLDILKDVHKRGILHRDIAPDNIFVTNEGVIKLIDFGAAKHATQADNSNKEIMLKVGYAPIEQYSRSAKQGPYTDLYAVAALFYRMLTGKKPQAANKRLQDDQVKSLSDLGIKIPYQAECAIMICLSIQPEYRLSSAEQFMEALDGKNFVPKYEKKWILPPEPTEKKTFIQVIKALPVGVKILAIFLCICLFGGVGTYFLTRNNDTSIIEIVSAKVDNYAGKTEKEASILAKKQGLEVEINYVFNKDVVDEVIEQDLASGSDLGETKKITLTVQTNESISIKELADLYQDSQDAREMAIGLGNEGLAKEGNNKDPQKVYGVLDYIETPNQQISSTQLSDSTERINVADITGIYYYISPFFYEKNVKDYTGKNIQDIKAMDLYKVENQTPIPNGSKSKPYANPLYYSFNQSEGYIVKQIIKNGLYDSRMTYSLFTTVKKQIKYNGKTGKDFRDELIDTYYLKKGNITIHGGKDTDKIEKVHIENGDGIKKDCFSKENAKNVKIVITTKPVATPGTYFGANTDTK